MKIVTRFSIPDPSMKFFANPMDPQDRERLAFKFKAFNAVTVPSVLGQTDPEWEWHIFAGRSLVDELHVPDPRVKIVFVDTMQEFKELADALPRTGQDPMMRLDDDDGLGNELVAKARSAPVCEALSFMQGNKYRFKDGTDAIEMTHMVYPRVAVGLTVYGKNPYNYWHTLIHKSLHVVYDTAPNQWLLCCSEHCYTKRRF